VSLQDQQTLISGHEHIGFAVKGDLQNPVVIIVPASSDMAGGVDGFSGTDEIENKGEPGLPGQSGAEFPVIEQNPGSS